MFFGFKQGDLTVQLNIADDEELQDQFAIVEKVKEMSAYWSQFKKFTLHMHSPASDDPGIPPDPARNPSV